MGMLIYVLPAPFLYGWWSAYQTDSLADDNYNLWTKKHTKKLGELESEPRQGDTGGDFDTLKKCTTPNFCYLWLLANIKYQRGS